MVATGTASRLVGGFLVAFLLPVSGAVAFPFVDPSNADSLPTGAPLGTELPAPDVTGLQNQLKLASPATLGSKSGWTIVPRITVQEIITDNAYEVESPRRFDAITAISPGIAVTADTSRLQLHLDYQPSLLLHAINGPLNAVTQQLNLTGLVTVVPDLAFVDLRALSGVQSRFGGLAGYGTLGNGNAALTPAGAGGYGAAGQAGTNPQNLVQTTSIGMSPYLLHQFKDYGTGKIGASIDASHYNPISGFVTSPIPTTAGGTGGQSLLTTEQIAQFTTGEFLGRLQSVFSIDLQQSKSYNGGGTAFVVTPGTTATAPIPSSNFTSQRETANDQLSYALNRTFTLLGSIGYERIYYSGGVAPQINGLTWNAGVTVTPSPNSSLTVTYGRQNGEDGFHASGHVALGGRTQVSVDYSNTVGTQLENLQNQLNLSAINVNGQTFNAVTGGPNNFAAANALGVSTGVFRFNTFNASLTTGWDRDTVQVSATWSIQTNLTPGNTQTGAFVDANGNLIILSVPVAGTGQSSDVKTGSIVWTHSLSPDLTLSSSASYSFISRSNGLGNDGSLATAVGLQYALSASTSLSARYSFFDRVSKIPGYSMYENILLLGFTKQF